MILTGACPRTAAAWTSNGKPHELRGLKHRPTGTVRIVPIPPILVSLLRQHIRESGTASDGRLFRSTRGGPLSESVYGRVWHAARQAALGPAQAATPLARRPYDLRHATLSCGCTPAARPPRSPPARAPACTSWRASMCIASAARKMSAASGSKTPLTPALAPRRNRHRWQQAVRRTAATTVGLSVICP